MKKIAPLLFALTLPIAGFAQSTVLDETFPLNGRTTLDVPDSAAWYSSSGSSNVVYSTGASITQNTGTGGRHLLAYFTEHGAPVTLTNTGDYVRVEFTFSINGSPGASASGTTAWRLGLFNSSAGTRVSTDSVNTAAAFTGYTGYTFTASPSTAGNIAFRERTNTTDYTLISDNAAYTAFSGVGTGQPLTYASQYTGVLTYTKAASGLDLNISFTGPNITNYTYSKSDTTPSALAFDTFAFINVSNVSDGFTFTSFQVTAIPEPSTYAAIFGALALGFVAWRRRRTA